MRYQSLLNLRYLVIFAMLDVRRPLLRTQASSRPPRQSLRLRLGARRAQTPSLAQRITATGFAYRVTLLFKN